MSTHSHEHSHVQPSRRRRRVRHLLLVGGPLVVIVGVAVAYFATGRYVGTENAYVKADKIMVAAEVPGQIERVAVHENQRVAAGDVLFTLDARSYRIALAKADAQLAVVAADIDRLKASYRQKIEERALARTNEAFAKKEFDRQAKLIQTNNVSHSKFDGARQDLDVAQHKLRVIDQEMAQILAQLQGDANIALADHPRYQEAKAARDRAALDLEHTVVRAPFAGIASNTPEVGQQVTGNSAMGGAVMSIVADGGVWVEANLKETDLTHVKVGQTVSVQVDAYPDQELTGRIDSIAQATGAEFSVIPPQNATGNWVKVVQRIPVRVALDAENGAPALRAGMSASVDIDTGYHRPVPGVVKAAMDLIGLPATANAEPAAKP